MRASDLSFDDDHLLVRPWADPVVDAVGHDPRSTYVERFYLGILGPSTTFFLRHLVERFDAAPDGYELSLADCAAALGLGRLRTAGAAFPRTVARSCQFGAARLAGAGVLEVRRRLPPLTVRQVRRLPPDRQAEHAHWTAASSAEAGSDGTPELLAQARRLALSLVELGEDRERTLHQMLRWRFDPAMAADAADWALDRHAAQTAPLPDDHLLAG
jgi:hypothetical protein